jgi:hypothetical protein
MFARKRFFAPILFVVTLCSCGSQEGAVEKKDGSPTVVAPVTAPIEISQLLVGGVEAGPITSSGVARPKPQLADEPIKVTVILSGPSASSSEVFLRLIDLKQGGVVGEKTLVFKKDETTATGEFSRIDHWTEGRHLREARMGREGKVVSRDLDVQPSQSAPKQAGA